MSPFLEIERDKKEDQDEKTAFCGKVNKPAVTGRHKKKKSLKLKLREQSRTPSTVQSSENKTASREDDEIKSDDQEVTAQEELPDDVKEPVKKEDVKAVKYEKKPNSHKKFTNEHEDEVQTPKLIEPLKGSLKRTSNQGNQGAVNPKAIKKSSSTVKSVTLRNSFEKSKGSFTKLLTTPKEAKQRRLNAFISSGKNANDHSAQKQRRRKHDTRSKEIPSEVNKPANTSPPRERSVYISTSQPVAQEVDMIEVMEARKAKEQQKAKEQKKVKEQHKAKDPQNAKDPQDTKDPLKVKPDKSTEKLKKDSQKKQQPQSKDKCSIM